MSQAPQEREAAGDEEQASPRPGGIAGLSARFRRLPRGRRIALVVSAAAAVIIAAVAGTLWYLEFLNHASTDDAFIDGHVSPVSPRVPGHVARVLVEDNEWVEAGEVVVELDRERYEVRRQAAAAALDAAMQQRDAAQLNVQLITARSQSALDEAQAGLEMARAQAESAQAAVTTARSQVRAAEADVNAGEARLKQAQSAQEAARAQADLDATRLRDVRQLNEQGAATQRELEDATAAAKVSSSNAAGAANEVTTEESNIRQLQAEVQVASDRLAQALAGVTESQSRVAQMQAALAAAQTRQTQIDTADAQAQAAQAMVNQAQAALAEAQLELSYTSVSAPLAGRITHKSVEPGQYVAVGQPMLAIVGPDVWVTANFKETDLHSIRPGQHVSIEVDAFPDAEFDGRVESIQAGSGAAFSLLPPQNATGNYVKIVQRVPVKIVFDPQPDWREYFLVPGMSVVPTIDLTSKPGAEASMAGPGAADAGR